MNKSQPFSWARLLLNQSLKKLPKPGFPFSRDSSTFRRFPLSQTPKFSFPGKTHYSTASSRAAEDLLAEVEKERQREREQRKRAGLDTKDIDEEDNEDYIGVMPSIVKLEKEKLKNEGDLNRFEENTDSDSEEDDERFTPDAMQKKSDEFQRKFKRHKELLKCFTQAETLDEAFKWMNKIDKFEQKHFPLRPEYRVIGELMNRLKVAEGKDKFILQHKLNRAMRLVDWKEAYDPNTPANYGIIQHQQGGVYADLEKEEQQKEQNLETVAADDDSDDEEEFDDMKEKDDILLEKLNDVDKKLEEKLAELDHTFGKKGKRLEEEIRNLAEERNALTEKKRKPLYRKGFDVKLIDVNRTCKVTKGGQVIKYAAILACGNYHGVVGYAKAKGPAIPIALQKAYEKCFQNLHYIERHEEHTIAHAVQTAYKKTKVYLWPAPTRTGMKAGRTVQTILNLAGFKNVKSKVVGSRNPHNTVKAVFKALNAIETPKDVQEKFGRTVVEKYLL
uniref:S5 DRBM domain-containing protein n=1 Tax=Cannabis sativa TaxID=3483 RepID=A0A803PBI6_CANSA